MLFCDVKLYVSRLAQLAVAVSFPPVYVRAVTYLASIWYMDERSTFPENVKLS